MGDDNKDGCEEYACGVHVVADDVFPNVPRVVVGFFHLGYRRGAFGRLDLLDGMLEQRAHGVGRGTEDEEHG